MFSHFSSTVCSEAMTKKVQQDSGEERVTAKSRPMMSLIARAPRICHLRCQKAWGRKAVEIKVPGVRKLRKRIERCSPLSTVTQVRRQGVLGYYHEQFIESSFSARYSKWEDDGAWSSQEWKADKSMDDGTVQPVVTSWERHTSPNQVSFMRRPSTMERCNPL